jgi:hypothetical protein
MKTQIAQIWNEVFKHGTTKMHTGAIFDEISYIKGYLSASSKECPSGIRENDPLYYSAHYDCESNIFKEVACMIYTAPPAGSHLALGSEKLRCVTIKDVTPEKIAKRFEKILRELVLPNINNFNNTQPVLTNIYTKLEF